MTDYEQAACYGQPTELFFDKSLYIQVKKIFCADCPVKEQCLQDCLQAEEELVDGRHYRSGVFGGTIPRERNRMMGTAYECLSDNGLGGLDDSDSD